MLESQYFGPAIKELKEGAVSVESITKNFFLIKLDLNQVSLCILEVWLDSVRVVASEDGT